jgi:glycosidase
MSPPWSQDAFFYHIYPLGLCAAPRRNDFQSAPVERLDALYPWLDHIQRLGANALYLGPLFESSSHGYNTVDYYQVDRRLGTNQTLAAFARELQSRGMRLVLDAVFNHVGRDFWAFRDLQANLERSAYRGWFAGLDFSRPGPGGDPFTYEGWSGHASLVKLNLANPEVRSHLFGAVRTWIEQFEIDGLRLDAADVIDTGFLADLAAACRGMRSDFWLLGEMVHGDYRRLLGAGGLDSVTNYEAYKALWSSLNDRNYFEIAYALNRQFGPGGVYNGAGLYNFGDNHDVDRAASSLKDPQHLPLLYALLFTMPGIPSIYYGSEWGLEARRTPQDDTMLRPALDLPSAAAQPRRALAQAIARLAAARRGCPALRSGSYRELFVAGEQFAFLRSHPAGDAVVALNAAAQPAQVEIPVPLSAGQLADRLDPAYRCEVQAGRLHLDLPPCQARILSRG